MHDGMRTVLVLLALWGSVSVAALRRWWDSRALDRRDDHLRALLAGAVPLPRQAPEDRPVRVSAD